MQFLKEEYCKDDHIWELTKIEIGNVHDPNYSSSAKFLFATL